MKELNGVLEAIRILSPLIGEVSAWLVGDGDEPDVLRLLPREIKSELALERMKFRQRHGV